MNQMMPYEFGLASELPSNLLDPNYNLYEANWKMKMMNEGYANKLYTELKNAKYLLQLAEIKTKQFENCLMEQRTIISQLQAENAQLRICIDELNFNARNASPFQLQGSSYGAGSTTTSLLGSSPEHDWPADIFSCNDRSSFYPYCDLSSKVDEQTKPARMVDAPSKSMFSLLSISDRGTDDKKSSDMFRATSMEFIAHTQKTQSDVEKTQRFIEKAKEIERLLENIDDQQETSIKKPNETRLFVGNLIESIDEACLMKYFSKYGTVVDSYVPRDTSGKHRGFAYITLSSLIDLQKVGRSQHMINGRKVYVDQGQYPKDSNVTQTILVSGIIHNTSNKTLKSYFSKYGNVVDIVRHQDSRRKLSRWAMVHFDSMNATKKVLETDDHTIEGHVLDIRCARNFQPSTNGEQHATKKSNHMFSARKLLISNLHQKTTSETLTKYFEKYGKVLDAYVPTVYGKNESRNFGYIVLKSEDVTFNFHGHHIDGTNVSIEDERSQYSKEKTKTLLISANPATMEKLSTDQLIKFFAKFGNIISCRKPTDPKTKKCSHYGFIEFSSTNAVDEAMKNFAHFIDGNLICISKSRHEQKK